MTYAKAYAAALAIIIAFIVGELLIKLPEEVTAAIATVLVPAVVAYVPNKEESDA